MQTLNNQTDRVTLTAAIADIFRQTLTRLGFCQRTAAGDLWQVAFKDVGSTRRVTRPFWWWTCTACRAR